MRLQKIALILTVTIISYRLLFAQWTPMGLLNRDVRSLFVTDSVIYAGTKCYGLYKSIDHGMNWITVNNGIVDSISSGCANRGICISGINATAAGLFVTTNDTVYFSNDNASSWSSIHAIDQPGMQDQYTGLFENNGSLFAQVYNYWGIPRLSRSDDDGLTWVNMPEFLTFSSISNYSYFTKQSGVYLSMDSGQNCLLQPNVNYPENSVITCIAARDTNEVFICTTDYFETRLSLTTDFANTWETIFIFPHYLSMLLAGSEYLIACDTRSVFISINNGNKWYPMNPGWPDDGHYIQNLIIHDDLLYAATTAGLFSLDISNVLDILNSDEFEVHVDIYPNPTSEFIHIESFFPIEKIELINIQGNFLHTWSEHPESVDVSNYPPGIYFIKITGEKGQYFYKKIIKK